MNIINNISGNHYSKLKKIMEQSDTLYIISPFLMSSFDRFFEYMRNCNIEHIHLVTTLKDKDIDLYNKANALSSFISQCRDSQIKYDIYIDNKLHGKIYVGKKSGEFSCGVLTSANLTEAGLSKNHEWGFWIEDTATLDTLLEESFSVATAISDATISKAINKISSHIDHIPKTSISLVVSDLLTSGSDDKRYFIKPIGHKEEPFDENRILSEDTETLHFSQKPIAVRVGDILICYGVGTRKLIGYFEVVSDPIHSEEHGRWPWTVTGKNLYPAYSSHWNEHDETLSKVEKAFSPVGKQITYAGCTTLGGLRYGKDKIRLTEEFAKYLIDLMRSHKETPLSSLDTSELDELTRQVGRILAKRCLGKSSDDPRIPYGELGQMLNPPHKGNEIEDYLNGISLFCENNRMPLLSVLVVASGSYEPKPGFFKRFFSDSPEAAWKNINREQYKLVKEYENWDLLYRSLQ